MIDLMIVVLSGVSAAVAVAVAAAAVFVPVVAAVVVVVVVVVVAGQGVAFADFVVRIESVEELGLGPVSGR